jgi:hypothetical protein
MNHFFQSMLYFFRGNHKLNFPAGHVYTDVISILDHSDRSSGLGFG